MKKILVSVLVTAGLISGGFFLHNYQQKTSIPECNSEEVNEALIKFFNTEFDKTSYSLDRFSITDITQRKSKLSESTNVCSGVVHFSFSYYGYAARDGEVKITYTAQKTLDNKISVDVYAISSKDLKQLND